MQKKAIAAAAILGALVVAQPMDKAEAKTDFYFGIGLGGPVVHHVHTPPRYYHRGHYYHPGHHDHAARYYAPKKRVFRKLRKRGFHHFRNVKWRNGTWRMTAVSPRGHLVRLKVDRRGHILRRKIVRYYY